MSVWKLAWRSIWRNARRTLVTVAAMAFALWVMVLYSGIVEGYLMSMERDVLDFEVGELQVAHPAYRDDPSLYNLLEDSDAAIAALEAAGFRVAPRLIGGGLAAHGPQSAGVMLRGIDVARDGATLRVSERLAVGNWLDPSDPKGVVLGRRLARTLGATPGAELVVLSQGTDGAMANDLYTVRGVLGTVADATDRTAIFMVEQAFRDLMVVPTATHMLILQGPVGSTLDEARASASALLPGAEVRTWRQLMPIVAQMLDGTKALIFFVFFIVYLAIGILVLNAMLMAVFERIREFGVLKAIGASPGLVLSMILAETALQLALAISIGLLLAIPAGVYMSTVGLNLAGLSGTSVVGLSLPPRWIASFSPASVAGPVVILVIMVAMAVIYPALKAALIRPVQAMRTH